MSCRRHSGLTRGVSQLRPAILTSAQRRHARTYFKLASSMRLDCIPAQHDRALQCHHVLLGSRGLRDSRSQDRTPRVAACQHRSMCRHQLQELESSGLCGACSRCFSCAPSAGAGQARAPSTVRHDPCVKPLNKGMIAHVCLLLAVACGMCVVAWAWKLCRLLFQLNPGPRPSCASTRSTVPRLHRLKVPLHATDVCWQLAGEQRARGGHAHRLRVMCRHSVTTHLA